MAFAGPGGDDPLGPSLYRGGLPVDADCEADGCPTYSGICGCEEDGRPGMLTSLLRLPLFNDTLAPGLGSDLGGGIGEVGTASDGICPFLIGIWDNPRVFCVGVLCAASAALEPTGDRPTLLGGAGGGDNGECEPGAGSLDGKLVNIPPP